MIFRWITSSSVGMESISVRMRAQASSMRSMALSGRNRSVMYRLDRVAAAMMAPSWIFTPWKTSYRSLRPRRMAMVSSTVGSFTITGWNRRSRAASFFDILAVLVQGGGPDAVELPPGQHGL